MRWIDLGFDVRRELLLIISGERPTESALQAARYAQRRKLFKEHIEVDEKAQNALCPMRG